MLRSYSYYLKLHGLDQSNKVCPSPSKSNGDLFVIYIDYIPVLAN